MISAPSQLTERDARRLKRRWQRSGRPRWWRCPSRACGRGLRCQRLRLHRGRHYADHGHLVTLRGVTQVASVARDTW